MFWFWKKKSAKAAQAPVSIEEAIRQKYASFRELLAQNNECLELMAGLQEDLQYGPATPKVLGDRVGMVFDTTASVVASLEKLTGYSYHSLSDAVQAQRLEVERHVAASQELVRPKLSAWMAEVDAGGAAEFGAKAAELGEVKNRLRLPVPAGYVLTAEAYRQFFGIPYWERIRDATRNIDLNDLEALRKVSDELTEMVMTAPIPRGVEIAIAERAHSMAQLPGVGLAVRSSGVGEGGAKTFAGQFLSLLNVPPDQVVDAYRRVIAGRFSERALFYRLSQGVPEVESPMAVLFLQLVPARASGIMYTRDPKDPKSPALWITATLGLGLDIASGRVPADLFVVQHKAPHRLVEQSIVAKHEQIVLAEKGGVLRQSTASDQADAPSLNAAQLEQLAEWGVRLEQHFGAPQDVEWALDHQGQIWIVQTRSLALAEASRTKTKAPKGEPIIAGGRTIYPGRVSGPTFLVSDQRGLKDTPEGAILFLRKASPEIVTVFPRVSGIVAELGNVAGHAAALLREAKIPAVFGMEGACDRLKNGDAVSLDAVQPRIYAGTLWSAREIETHITDRYRERSGDVNPINRRLLVLHLLDPAGSNFTPKGCQSAHDVLRFCHEKGVEAMFAVNDTVIEGAGHAVKKLMTPVPVNICVLDLGGGLALEDASRDEVDPAHIASRPFQALWRGLTHPGVSWQRGGMPVGVSDLASVISNTLTTTGAMRALGDRSYLLVADEYMNLNSRLAYHFTLVDACVSDIPGNNYISFRFAGGGATAERRNLRACFIEGCLAHYGFLVDRRGDLVNAWFKKAPAEATADNLDILGRLMACTSQLDMYMTGEAAMRWYVQQFLAGNYAFQMEKETAEKTTA